jgi:hypothetical protein
MFIITKRKQNRICLSESEYRLEERMTVTAVDRTGTIAKSSARFQMESRIFLSPAQMNTAIVTGTAGRVRTKYE